MTKHFRKLLSVLIATLFVLSAFSPFQVNAMTSAAGATSGVTGTVVSGPTKVKSITFDGNTYDAVVPAEYSNYMWRVLEYVNQERAKYGLTALVMDYNLSRVALGRAAETTAYFDHTRPNGESCFSVFPSAQGYVGENLACGYSFKDPKAVVDAWMNSPGHRANILRKEFRSIGIGLVYTSSDNYGYYVAQSFGDTVQNVMTYTGTIFGGVDYSSIYNYDYYVSKNADVKKACEYSRTDSFSVIKHFINYGMAEGRASISSFNVKIYRDNYPDLNKAFGKDLKKYYLHFFF